MPAHRFLLRELVRRDLQGRYAGSALGVLWSFLQPLWQLLLFTFVFEVVLRMRPVGEGTDRFWVFLLCGLLPWMAVQEGVSRGATAITDNANLVKKLHFPSEVLVLTVATAALVHEAIAAVVLVPALLVLGELSWRGLPWLLLAVPLQLLLTCGVGLLLGAVQVFFRDLTQLVGMLLQAWFYLTPIVYPLGFVPERLRPLLDLNPLTALVGLYRTALLGGPVPSGSSLSALVLAALVATALGWQAFRRLQPAFVDEL
ncbi:MAG TPA: ABC transporter permease [Thermoanaerobaculia bacterium]|nr:ABC transporter permease [Thermoanaerobaculia bacterium]